jgi:DJ-1/PfpI family
MDDEDVVGPASGCGARCVFSVCTGALVCGAAGLLKGRRATTHWAALHLLPFFGAVPVNDRVVVDGNMVFAAGVTAGLDAALRVAADLRGVEVAQTIQLYMQYAPEPPFDSGTPETAPPAIHESARQAVKAVTEQREITARPAPSDTLIKRVSEPQVVRRVAVRSVPAADIQWRCRLVVAVFGPFLLRHHRATEGLFESQDQVVLSLGSNIKPAVLIGEALCIN